MIKIQESFQSSISKAGHEIKGLKETTNIHEMNLGVAAKQLKEQKTELDKIQTTAQDSMKSFKEEIVAKMLTKEELTDFSSKLQDEVKANQPRRSLPVLVVIASPRPNFICICKCMCL